MRFYGLSYREVMDTPIRVFWIMSRNVSRIQAEEELRMLPLHTAVASSDPKAVKNLRDMLTAEIGTVVVREEKLDREGLNRLKMMAGQRIGQKLK